MSELDRAEIARDFLLHLIHTQSPWVRKEEYSFGTVSDVLTSLVAEWRERDVFLREKYGA